MNVTVHTGDVVCNRHFTHTALLITLLAVSLPLEEILMTNFIE